jgi:4-amino-4-deoxychorismate lyase
MGRGVVESALRAGAGAPGLKLIETCGWDGAGFGARLPLHLARLMQSAQALGWACDLGAVQAALDASVVPGRAMRVRLTLDQAGMLEVIVADLPAAQASWRVGLAPARLMSSNPWLAIKSTRRDDYDTARAHLPPGVDEVVFQNERGEVCDGTITNVFFDRGQGMRTPPLSAGLLPGVLRAELAVREEVLLASDLPVVQLWVGNSLRGLIPALWVDI